MSYILDALKKAERERGLSEVPTLDTIHDLPEKKRLGIWIASALFVLCVVLALWLFLPSTGKDGGLAPSEAGKSVQAVSPAGIEETRSARAVVVPAAPAAVVPSAQSSEESQRVQPSTSNNPGIEARRSVLAEARSELSTQESARRNAAVKQRETPAREERSRPVQPQNGGRGADASSPAVQARPESLREAMTQMTMTVHLYSENKSERLVFINGKKYVEGDHIEPDILLESITPDGAVLRYGGERLVLHPGAR